MFDPPDQAAVEASRIGRTRFVAVVRRRSERGRAAPAQLSIDEAVARSTVALPTDQPPGSILTGLGFRQELEPPSLVREQTSFPAVSVVAHEGGLALVDELVAASYRPPGIEVIELTPEAPISIYALRIEGAERSLVSDTFVEIMGAECAAAAARQS